MASPMDLSSYTLPATVTEAWSEANGGYVITLNTTGYSSGMVIMCGIRADLTVGGAVCLSSGETLGYEKTYGENFRGLNAEAVTNVDTISGATRTTAAYRAAVQDALNAAMILSGGSVDIRTEEEILADNLASALPAGEGAFTKLFLCEHFFQIGIEANILFQLHRSAADIDLDFSVESLGVYVARANELYLPLLFKIGIALSVYRGDAAEADKTCL